MLTSAVYEPLSERVILFKIIFFNTCCCVDNVRSDVTKVLIEGNDNEDASIVMFLSLSATELKTMSPVAASMTVFAKASKSLRLEEIFLIFSSLSARIISFSITSFSLESIEVRDASSLLIERNGELSLREKRRKETADVAIRKVIAIRFNFGIIFFEVLIRSFFLESKFISLIILS